ncbi:SIR2 family protein [Geodermatophilus sp. SYSU D00700]
MESHVSLALALDAGPGTLAALIGAGASASAGLATAWDVRQELIRRVARASGAPTPPDPEAWWRQRSGSAGYDDLLAELAPTPAGRRDLLRGFFEPTAEERERGEKQPGAAHHALARLVVAGAVRVVLTTNFDPLLETAIRQAGIEPVVVDSPAAVAGMEPLQHQRAVVVHLHGHYLSPETLNTPEELGAYPPQVTELLDEVFDRYGLLVVGWSAAWDVALRQRLQAARSPRYGTWWIDRSPLREHALALAAGRGARVVVDDAGAFLSRAGDAVDAVREARLQDPVGAAAAVAYAKRVLSGRTVAIGLHDTLRREADRVAALQPLGSRQLDGLPAHVAAEHAGRLEQLLVGTEVFAALVATCAYWGSARTDSWWLPSIARLVPRRIVGGSLDLINLRLGPAALLTHAAGIAAAAAGRDELIARLLTGQAIQWQGEVRTAGAVLTPAVLWAHDRDPDLRLREHLRPLLQDHLAVGAATYADAWDRWALLCYLERRRTRVNHPRAPLLLVDGHAPAYAPAVVALREHLSNADAAEGLLAHGHLGGTPDAAEQALHDFERWLAAWADREDWNALPPGGGVLDTGPRFPGRPQLTDR